MLKSLLKSFFYRFGYSIHKLRPLPAAAALAADAGELRLLPMLHAQSPYENFPLADYPEDLQGWGSQSAAFDELLPKVRPQRIIEVGTWKGGSAIHMATVARKLGISPEIICVDTWLGAVEFWTDQADPERYLALKCRHGYPTVYYQFVANVIHKACQDLITPFPQTSTIAALWFRRYGIKAELIYIDGSHEEEDVYADLVSYWDLLRPGGVLVGDDWNWDGVRLAATRFAKEHSLAITQLADKWYLEKS
jgi:predicted O-methyltransferase YrrM